MSYDLRLAVKVEGTKDLYAVIAEPEYDSPTYNIGEMFRACMGWDFEQGKRNRVRLRKTKAWFANALTVQTKQLLAGSASKSK